MRPHRAKNSLILRGVEWKGNADSCLQRNRIVFILQIGKDFNTNKWAVGEMFTLFSF